jgi:hypothetical protein
MTAIIQGTLTTAELFELPIVHTTFLGFNVAFMWMVF